ncbi:ParA family protein [Novosphingobium sp.]|uniref:ParA family protein n=1 Tax=Novosphingobium sp. TaxID=1874826 RepID=UPI00286C4A66|nr:ParA family protein [Novosphingobium sp.]
MAVIAVYSMKGGVGKTTLAVDLAWRLASAGGRNTLLWDLDPQAGAGFLLGFDPVPHGRAAAAFQRDGKPRQLIERTAYERLSLIPGDESLRHLPGQLARLGQRRRLATMTNLLKSDFERIVIDCPAGLSEISDQVIAAADVLIVPLPASPLSARALEMLRRELVRHHHRHPPLLPVLSMYNSRRPLHRAVREGAAAGWPVIPFAAQLEQVAVERAPLGTFAAHGDAARALARLCNGIEARLMADAQAPGQGTLFGRQTAMA